MEDPSAEIMKLLVRGMCVGRSCACQGEPTKEFEICSDRAHKAQELYGKLWRKIHERSCN